MCNSREGKSYRNSKHFCVFFFQYLVKWKGLKWFSESSVAQTLPALGIHLFLVKIQKVKGEIWHFWLVLKVTSAVLYDAVCTPPLPHLKTFETVNSLSRFVELSGYWLACLTLLQMQLICSPFVCFYFFSIDGVHLFWLINWIHLVKSRKNDSWWLNAQIKQVHPVCCLTWQREGMCVSMKGFEINTQPPAKQSSSDIQKPIILLMNKELKIKIPTCYKVSVLLNKDFKTSIYWLVGPKT